MTAHRLRRTPAGSLPAGVRRARPRRGGAGCRWASGAVLVVLGCLATDAAVLTGRIDRVAVQFPEGPGETWVLIGEDSRAELPAGASVATFGTEEQVPGSRADVVLVVHTTGERTTVLSVPRDVVVPDADMPGRLALSWLRRSAGDRGRTLRAGHRRRPPGRDRPGRIRRRRGRRRWCGRRRPRAGARPGGRAGAALGRRPAPRRCDRAGPRPVPASRAVGGRRLGAGPGGRRRPGGRGGEPCSHALGEQAQGALWRPWRLQSLACGGIRGADGRRRDVEARPRWRCCAPTSRGWRCCPSATRWGDRSRASRPIGPSRRSRRRASPVRPDGRSGDADADQRADRVGGPGRDRPEQQLPQPGVPPRARGEERTTAPRRRPGRCRRRRARPTAAGSRTGRAAAGAARRARRSAAR